MMPKLVTYCRLGSTDDQSMLAESRFNCPTGVGAPGSLVVMVKVWALTKMLEVTLMTSLITTLVLRTEKLRTEHCEVAMRPLDTIKTWKRLVTPAGETLVHWPLQARMSPFMRGTKG